MTRKDELMQERDQYRGLARWNLILVLVAIALAVVLVFRLTQAKHPGYYATTREGAIKAMVPLDMPLITEEYIRQWASVAVRKSFSFNFSEFDKDLEQVVSLYTPSGMRSFKAALSNSGLANTVENKHLIINAVVNGAVVILNQGVISGRYHWMLQVPVLLTFESASEKMNKQLYVELAVSRVATLNALQGIQIVNLAAKSVDIKS